MNVGINPKQLRDEIIIPALEKIELNSPAAVRLLLGTLAQESHMACYVKQIKGPACGPFQMEPATHNDIWQNFIPNKPQIRYRITRSHAEDMIFNFRYATQMARIHYFRVSAPLPSSDDKIGLANYWKKYYNTHLGAGTVEEFLSNFSSRVESFGL